MFIEKLIERKEEEKKTKSKFNITLDAPDTSLECLSVLGTAGAAGVVRAGGILS